MDGRLFCDFNIRAIADEHLPGSLLLFFPASQSATTGSRAGTGKKWHQEKE